MDIFTWKTQLQDTIEMSYGQNVREVNFGDGYTQVAGLGINIHNEKWALTWTNPKNISLDILKFLQLHITKSFIWKNPSGKNQIYRVVKDSIKSTPLSQNVLSISAEFKLVHSS